MRNRRFGSTRIDDIAAAQHVREAAKAPEQEGPPLSPELEDERTRAFWGASWTAEDEARMQAERAIRKAS